MRPTPPMSFWISTDTFSRRRAARSSFIPWRRAAWWTLAMRGERWAARHYQGGQARDFPVLSSNCQMPSSAQAYSMNFTVVPVAGQALGYLTVWPAGRLQPLVSTLNNPTATIVANAAIVPAGAGGAIAVYPRPEYSADCGHQRLLCSAGCQVACRSIRQRHAECSTRARLEEPSAVSAVRRSTWPPAPATSRVRRKDMFSTQP